MFIDLPGVRDDDRYSLCRQLERSLDLPGPMLVLWAGYSPTLGDIQRHAFDAVYVRALRGRLTAGSLKTGRYILRTSSLPDLRRLTSENRPQRGQFLPDLQAHSPTKGQKDGEKWTAAVDLQPTP